MRSAEAEYISSQCAVDLTASSTTSGMAPPTTRTADVIVRPVAVKLPLRVVSDRMNVDAGAEWPSRLAGKAAGGAGARDVNRFPPSINENVTGEKAEEMWSAGYDGDAHSNSDDEVCDVFSRARRLQAAAAVSGWLSFDVVDGRRCVRLLRAAAALATGGAAVARSTRWNGLPRRWLHDSRTSAVMNAVELPRPFLDFAKMQKTCLKRRRKLRKQRKLKSVGERCRQSSTVPAPPPAPRPLPVPPVLNTSPASVAALDPAVFSFRSIWLLGAAPSSATSVMRTVG